jgi:hypothetical protein
MSRASRTAEILAAAGLVPLQLEQERIRAGRDAARSTALASLLPALIDTGAGIAGRVAQADLAERKFNADVEARKARDAAVVESRNARTAAEAAKAAAEMAKVKAKAEADRAKAALEAEAARPAREAKGRENALAELRSGAAGRSMESLIGTASMDERLGFLDDDAVRAIQAEEMRKAKQGEAAAKLAERKAAAPLGGGARQPSPDAAMRSEKLRLEVARLRNEAVGGPGSSRDTAATAVGEKRRQQVLEVENFTSNLDRNIQAVQDMIDKTGTFELMGPEGQVMDRRLTEIATDLAKLADPGSVAREGEVKLMRQGLVDSGLLGLATSNKTAKEVLEALRSDVKQRRAEAYNVRGLDIPGAAGSSPAATAPAAPTKPRAEMSDADIEARLNQLKAKK